VRRVCGSIQVAGLPAAAVYRGLLLVGIVLGLVSAARAQDSFQSNSGSSRLPADLYDAAAPAPDLRKYLSADGRFIDQCRYWHDHPDAYTRMYGQPDHFAPGRIGETRSFNGEPPPYMRCAVDPCPPNGYICWRDPAKPTPLSAQLQAVLKAQGCEAQPNGDIYCQKDRMPHPGPPSPTLSSGLVKSVCRVIAGGISCDPSTSSKAAPGNDSFQGKAGGAGGGVSGPDFIRQTLRQPQPPPARPAKYAPLDWNHVPACPDPVPSAQGGPTINYFWIGDPHAHNIDWVSDSRYITVGGHGGAGAPGLGSCSFPQLVGLISPRQIAADVHALLIRPGNANKMVRLAGCDTADADPKDPNSVPTAQQVADAYRELYGTPISVEGYKGDIQYDQPTGLQQFACRVFRSRPPLPGS
jgi:hypothetical protein